jgi:uncharacterized membrane protein YqaE (UPF0057 family)
MKKMITLALAAMLFIAGTPVFAGNVLVDPNETNTAEEMYQMARENMDNLDQASFKAAYEQMTLSEKKALLVMAVNEVNASGSAASPDAMVAYYILAIIAPPIAVAIYTNLGMETVWNIIWTILGWIPGVIHAFIVLGR